ncbi:hypothetical protein PAPYR_4797 [Paratrimastix pyriformis]|uniref:SAM domain-containing protein n=1 Tax=Paratrimastix pyriformis TaxID=342808 RepID=A0ABQ8ULE1_9EUKA|nr:hypothetical protein PAPYR_4797 [Paratrimastix pyriformis]
MSEEATEEYYEEDVVDLTAADALGEEEARARRRARFGVESNAPTSRPVIAPIVFKQSLDQLVGGTPLLPPPTVPSRSIFPAPAPAAQLDGAAGIFNPTPRPPPLMSQMYTPPSVSVPSMGGIGLGMGIGTFGKPMTPSISSTLPTTQRLQYTAPSGGLRSEMISTRAPAVDVVLPTGQRLSYGAFGVDTPSRPNPTVQLANPSRPMVQLRPTVQLAAAAARQQPPQTQRPLVVQLVAPQQQQPQQQGLGGRPRVVLAGQQQQQPQRLTVQLQTRGMQPRQEVADVQTWLRSIGLFDCLQMFQRTDGAVLLRLTEQAFMDRFKNNLEAGQVGWAKLQERLEEENTRPQRRGTKRFSL